MAKTYQVTLYYHQAVLVKVEAENEEEAIKNAYYADFDDPNSCTQLGWEEDGSPEVEEL
jgi:hypothetical protein